MVADELRKSEMKLNALTILYWICRFESKLKWGAYAYAHENALFGDLRFFAFMTMDFSRTMQHAKERGRHTHDRPTLCT